MKLSTKQYASALHRAISGKSEIERKHIIRNFLFILQKNRDWQRLGLILKEVERLYLRESGLRKVEVETASPVKNLRNELEMILGKNIFMKEKINPEILAGIKILIDDEFLIDASAKGRVDKMFSKHSSFLAKP